MAFEASRRQVLSGTLLGAACAALPALPATSRAIPAPPAGQPVVRLYMGVPELVPPGHDTPYRPHTTPCGMINDHAQWWMC